MHLQELTVNGKRKQTCLHATQMLPGSGPLSINGFNGFEQWDTVHIKTGWTLKLLQNGFNGTSALLKMKLQGAQLRNMFFFKH